MWLRRWWWRDVAAAFQWRGGGVLKQRAATLTVCYRRAFTTICTQASIGMSQALFPHPASKRKSLYYVKPLANVLYYHYSINSNLMEDHVVENFL